MTTRDMTVGSPSRQLIAFAVPLLLGNLFQQLYNVADTMIVGHALGDTALAAMGATGSVYNLLVLMITGACSGFSITVARRFGAGDGEGVRQASAQAVLLGFMMAASMTAAGLLCADPLLRALGTPAEVMPDALAYLRVFFSGMVCTMLYNMAAGLLRALGNSRAPLYFLIIAVLANIGLDLLFVQVFSFGVAGAAVATVLAQLISVLCCLLYILKKVPQLHLAKRHFHPDRATIGQMLPLGLSMGVSLSVVEIGTVVLQSGVNSLGTATITAHTAARRLACMSMLPLSTVGAATATFASQNLGAGRYDRIDKGIKSAFCINAVWCLLMLLLMLPLGGPMTRLLTGTEDPYVVQTSALYLQVNVPFYLPLSVLFIYRHVLQGIGDKLVPVLSSAIEMAGKLLITFALIPRLGYMAVCIVEPLTWVACAAVLFGIYRVKTRAYRT